MLVGDMDATRKAEEKKKVRGRKIDRQADRRLYRSRSRLL